jgi:hypothetical protein
LIFSLLFGILTGFFMKKLFLNFRAYLPAILVVGVLLIPEIIFAQSVNASTEPGSDTLKALAELSGVIIEILTFLALLMLNFFGDLLGTDMITGKEAMEAIRPMWMWVRNLTNIMFVGVLLFLAFSNLFSSLGFGGEGGSWTIKEKLPKLIIAIIAINFSLLGLKVVIDAINVGTVAILGIADNRLEPDINGLRKTLKGSRSWVKIDKTRKEEIETSITVDSNEKILTPDEVSEINVKSGIDCTNTWDKFTADGTKTCDADGCAIFAESGSDWFVCRGFTEAINDMFCRNWIQMDKGDDATQARRDYAEGDDKCVFMMQPEKFETILEPGSEPGQNLFGAFGSVFMHLERLPALGADINSLGAVVTNTLFSAILAIAFIVALVAIFIAMVSRVIVLWITLVFSPLLIGASILGVDGGKGGDISEKIVTHLIMPLKVAAAFAIGFVMMSAMMEWHADTTESTFIFGSALSQLGIDEYGFLWQIATIVIFWKVAFWAVEGSLADTLVQGVRSAAEIVGESAARSLTIDRPMFSVGTGENKSEFSVGSLLKMPQLYSNYNSRKAQLMDEGLENVLGWKKVGFAKVIQESKMDAKSVDSVKKVIIQAKDLNEFISNKDQFADKIKFTFGAGVADKFRTINNIDDVNTALKEIAVNTGESPITLQLSDFGNSEKEEGKSPVKVGGTEVRTYGELKDVAKGQTLKVEQMPGIMSLPGAPSTIKDLLGNIKDLNVTFAKGIKIDGTKAYMNLKSDKKGTVQPVILDLAGVSDLNGLNAKIGTLKDEQKADMGSDDTIKKELLQTAGLSEGTHQWNSTENKFEVKSTPPT